MSRSIKHKETQLPVLMSVALDRLRGSILVTNKSLSLLITQFHKDQSTGLYVSGVTYSWKIDEKLLFLGVETKWKCIDDGRRRGHLMILTPAGIGYLHPRDASSVRLFSEVIDEIKENNQSRIDQD